jgi:hypothetical protein
LAGHTLEGVGWPHLGRCWLATPWKVLAGHTLEGVGWPHRKPFNERGLGLLQVLQQLQV